MAEAWSVSRTANGINVIDENGLPVCTRVGLDDAKLIASAPLLQEHVRILREAAEDARQELEAQAAYFGSHLATDNNLFRILRKLESVLEATKEGA